MLPQKATEMTNRIIVKPRDKEHLDSEQQGVGEIFYLHTFLDLTNGIVKIVRRLLKSFAKIQSLMTVNNAK